LIDLERGLLVRLARLQTIEAKLWREVARRRGRAGRRAVRQIERDRQRLGRELHTGVGQLLAAIRIQAELLGAHLIEPAPAVQEALYRIQTLAGEALDQVRTVSRRLYPPEWQRLSLDVALRQLWEMSGVAQRFAGVINIQPIPRDPDPEVKTLLYRAAQEALSNIMRHAGATRVDLALSSDAERIYLTVQDNGKGFEVSQAFSGAPAADAGIGLRAVREQALELGGKLVVRSSPIGTTLEVSARFEP
jgi:signal transduction histidine kinase